MDWCSSTSDAPPASPATRLCAVFSVEVLDLMLSEFVCSYCCIPSSYPFLNSVIACSAALNFSVFIDLGMGAGCVVLEVSEFPSHACITGGTAIDK
jgi:hypothetical protein